MRRLALPLVLLAAFAAGVVSFGSIPPAVSRQTLSPRGGGERWKPSSGPGGGPVLALAVAPSAPETVYAGTWRGAFRSVNGGRSWTAAGLVQRPALDSSAPVGVTSLVVDPRAPGTVYAGLHGKWVGRTTDLQSVFKSTNGGRTWRALGLRGQPVAIGPTGPPTVYAAAGGSGGNTRLLRSTDGGRSWQPADRGLPPTDQWALAFDPTSPATVYAAMGQGGVFESNDSGGSWHTLGVSPAYGDVSAIAVDPQHAQTIYAGTNAGVIESLDGGRSWRIVNATMGAHGRDRGYMQVTALLVDPRDSRALYATAQCAGVFRSTDGGRRWSSANAGLVPRCGTFPLAVDPRAAQTVYAADGTRGVLRSSDGGIHWQAVNDGLSLTPVSSLAVDPQSSRTVYASAGPLGLFKSTDGGVHWRSIAPGLTHEVALDPGNPANVLAVRSAYGIVRSTDAGRTWAEADFGPDARWVNLVAISGKRAYAGTSGHGLFGSTDGGRTWHGLGPPGSHVGALAIAPRDPATVYAGIWGSAARGLDRSTDGGRTWQRLTDSLDTDVDAIALDPESPATVYIVAGDGILKTTDGGASWQPANAGLARLRAKTNTGKWVTYVVGVSALVIDAAHPATLYAATYGRGVYRSTDAAKSWQSLNAGLTVQDVRALALDATGRTLYAGTSGGGVVSLRTRT